MAKNPSVDLLKGLLILLVMVGHAMELTHQEHMALWIGSGFRMPLMIGISGYLLNVTQTRTRPSAVFFKRYADRMLLPWIVALVVYMLIGGWPIDWTTPIELVLRPPFHLWYVPLLFLLIVLTRILSVSPVILLAIAAPLSLATMYSFGLDRGVIDMGQMSFDNRYLHYPVYFFAGMWVAGRVVSARGLWAAMALSALGMMWWAYLYDSGNIMAFVPARLIMCLGLIALLPLLSGRRLYCAPLNAIGRQSLFFYLWHPLVMGLILMVIADAASILILSLILLTLANMLVMRQATVARLFGSMVRPRTDVYAGFPSSGTIGA